MRKQVRFNLSSGEEVIIDGDGHDVDVIVRGEMHLVLMPHDLANFIKVFEYVLNATGNGHFTK